MTDSLYDHIKPCIKMYQEDLEELHNDGSAKTLFNIKGAMAWLCEETEIKYPNSTKCIRKNCYLFHFHFQLNVDLVNDLLVKKKNK